MCCAGGGGSCCGPSTVEKVQYRLKINLLSIEDYYVLIKNKFLCCMLNHLNKRAYY